MSQPRFVSRNGILIPPSEACVSVFNPAIYGAYGIYESMQVTNGVVFALEAHLDRLAHSAALLAMKLPGTAADLASWVAEVISANAALDCTLRLFVIGEDEASDPIAFIWPQEPTRYPDAFYREGVSTVTFTGCRYLPEAKSLNTLASYMARKAARSAGAHEGLLVHDGDITEGSNSNLFAVLDGEVITPPVDRVLSGVTRDTVVSLARLDGIPLREATLPAAGVADWEECFITSTTRHVMPVTQIDGLPVGDGRVGPMTRRLSALFEEYFTRHVMPG